MHITCHLGAHCTAQKQLFDCLFYNRDYLAQNKIIIPDPREGYHALLSELLEMLQKPQDISSDILEKKRIEFFSSLTHQQDEDVRIILFWEHFLTFSKWAFRKRLYPSVGQRVQDLIKIFPSNAQLSFHMALRSMSSFIPSLHQKFPSKSWKDFLSDTKPKYLNWLAVIRDIAMQAPNIPLTLWRDEDSPLIWHQLLQNITTHPKAAHLKKSRDFIDSLITPHGMQLALDYIRSNQITDPETCGNIMLRFAQQHPRTDGTHMLTKIPGWTEETLLILDEIYEDDIAAIAAMPSVTLIAP